MRDVKEIPSFINEADEWPDQKPTMVITNTRQALREIRCKHCWSLEDGCFWLNVHTKEKGPSQWGEELVA
jgi:hypothetical protein